MFLADNIQALYNAGVRYIFIEGGLPLDEGYMFIMFYPWMASGWRYESISMYQAITDFNNSLHTDDTIKLISPEKTPPNNMISGAQLWNFRDSSAAETIIEIMDTSSDNTKAIILYGALHTRTDVFKQYYHYDYHERFEWLPLGYHLKNHYGNNFSSYYFVTHHDKNLITSPKHLVNESKLVLLKNMPFANNVPAEYIKINYSRDILSMYHNHMYNSDVESFNIRQIPGKYIDEGYLLKAQEMFPDDIWPLYWLGFVAAEKEQWEKGLGFFQELFTKDLAYSMEGLPLAYKKAALCAEKSGNRQLADEYHRIAGALFNEYNIIVDINRSSYVGYFFGLGW